MNQTLWIGALALSVSLVGGCANAQPNLAKDPDAQQPQPEAVKGPPARRRARAVS